MWPVALLKKHNKPTAAAKKLQSIHHQGKLVKGLILEEWAVGAWARFNPPSRLKNLDACVGIGKILILIGGFLCCTVLYCTMTMVIADATESTDVTRNIQRSII
jgi:hypothetical protein